MIAIAGFVIGGLASWAHLVFIGPVTALGLRVWPLWFVATAIGLAISVAYHRPQWGVVVLAVITTAILLGNLTIPLVEHKVAAQAVKSALVGFLLVWAAAHFRAAPVFIAALLFLAVAPVGLLSFWMPNMLPHAVRMPHLVAWSFWDISAGLQHVGLIALSLGSVSAELASSDAHRSFGASVGPASVARMEIPPRKGQNPQA